jgi:hypothetical protein
MISQALLLKPFAVGKNPLEIDAILASIRRFSVQGSSSGGYPVPDGYFAPTPMYDKAMIGNHVHSKYPHLDALGEPINELDEHTSPVQTGRGQK